MASPVRDAINKVLALYPAAVVVERGRGRIKQQIGPNRYVIQTQAGGAGWHYGAGPYTEAHEVDTAWEMGDNAPYRRRMLRADYNAFAGLNDALNFDAGQIVKYQDPTTGENITFQPQALEWSNDLDQLSQIGAVQQVPGSVQDDSLTWVGAFGPGLDFRWTTDTTRLQKLLTVQSAGAIGMPPQFILDGGNPVLRLQFIFQRSAGVRAYVDGMLFGEKNKEQLITANQIEFRSTATGQMLWNFERPRAWDSGEEDMLPSGAVMRVRATAQNLFVEIRVPWEWLQTAVFPVYIDPTVNPAVATSLDDAYELADGTCNPTALEFDISLDTGDAKYMAARFQINIPNGSTINTAYMTWYSDSGSRDDADVTIDCEVDAAQYSTGANDISSRSLVGSPATWQQSGLGVGFINTSSVVTPVQAAVNAAGWAANDYMGFVLEAQSTTTIRLRFQDQDSSAPSVYIDYTEGGAPAGQPMSLRAAQVPGMRQWQPRYA